METRVKTDIQQYIVSTWLSGDQRGFDDNTDLQESGVLDSFSTLALIGFLEETFKIKLDPSDINAETLKNVNAVTQMVLSKLAPNNGSKAG